MTRSPPLAFRGLLVVLISGLYGCGVDQVVDPPVATTVRVSPTDATLTSLGETTQLTATVLDQGGNPMAGDPPSWSSSAPSVATVTPGGLVTAVSNGVATITATAGSVEGSASVTVGQTASTVVASASSLALRGIGTTAFVTATVKDPGGTLIAAPSLVWSSDDPSVATVSSAGLVTAATAGATTLRVEATAGGATVAEQVAVTVTEFLAMVTTVLPGAVEGLAYGPATLQATGGSDGYAWSVASGALPAGLTLEGPTGEITGTPTAAGSEAFTVEVASGDGQTVQQALSITVAPSLAITTTSLPSGVQGVAYGPETVQATGGTGGYTWSVASGSLPAGLTMDDSTGEISGTPTAAGTEAFTVEAMSDDGQTAEQQLSITVSPLLAVTTTSLPDGLEGVAYGPEALQATGGGGGYAWSVASGSLPAGLALDDSTGGISGTPTAAGTEAFTVQAMSGDGQTAEQQLSITVRALLAVTTASLPDGLEGVAYGPEALQATGGSGGYAWSLASGSLPAGLTLSGSTGEISGTPTAPGTQAFTVEVASDDGQKAQRSLSIAVIATLLDGVPVLGLVGSQDDRAYWRFPVPPATPQLDVIMGGGTGDADLYVRQGALPTTSVYDCRPFLSGGTETCSFSSPASGDWFVMLHAFTAYTGVSLTATTSAACTLSSVPDSDGDRLPDCAETNTGSFVGALNTGTDPNDPDTDGDMITDGDEVLGTLAGLDLPGFGVSPLVPTILVEYDWFDDSGHSHRPTAAQLSMVTASFAAQGIEVIHDYGQGPAPFTGGNLILDADGNVDGLGSEYYAYKASHFAANRSGYFHYNMHPHRYNNGNSSGLAELFGDDLLTATLSFYADDLAVAGTIQHELGHNLGLSHGGGDDVNRKPNYPSVMNYNYQFAGVDDDCTPIPDGVLTYSHGLSPTLDENDLDEPLGICGGPPGWDWNQDGDASDLGIQADITRRWSPLGSGDGIFQVLDDHDDWGSLSFIGIGDSDGALYVSTRLLAICPVPPSELLQAFPPPR